MLLKNGSKGREAQALQQALIKHGYRVVADGDFGPGTERALKKFQQSKGLLPDGIAGQITLKALGIKPAPAPTPPKPAPAPAPTPANKTSAQTTALWRKASTLWSGSAQPKATEHFEKFSLLLDPIATQVQLKDPVQVAHFLGQIKQEVGPQFLTLENLNYSVSTLKRVFKVFRLDPKAAERYGSIKGKQAANPVMIANMAYANRIGNGDIKSGDGARFMGGGAKQLTGRANYQGYDQWLRSHFPDIYQKAHGAAIMSEGAKLLSSAPHAMLSALYFWHKEGLYKCVGSAINEDSCNKVTKIVNRHTDSYFARYSNTCEAARLLGISNVPNPRQPARSGPPIDPNDTNAIRSAIAHYLSAEPLIFIDLESKLRFFNGSWEDHQETVGEVWDEMVADGSLLLQEDASGVERYLSKE